jgi:hypothetical protein
VSASRATVRLLFVEEGAYHHEDITVPAEALSRYERLIDLLQEDPDVLRHTFVDLKRLCSARVLEED